MLLAQITHLSVLVKVPATGNQIAGHARERLSQDRVISHTSCKAQWRADVSRQSTGEALIPGHQ